jgi:hypothetical protein
MNMQLIEKYIKISDNIKNILNLINFENNNIFIAGGFALSLYKNFEIPYTDIDIWTDNIKSIDISKFDINALYGNDISYRYHELKYLKNVYKLKYNDNSIDLIELHSCLNLNSLIYRTLDNFDLDCCKIACTYNGYDTFTFYIHNEFYNNYARIKNGDMKKTIERIEKYKIKGIYCELQL